MSEQMPEVIWDDGKFKFQKKLGTFVQYFQVNLPVNGNGLPMQLINPLALAGSMLDCETTDDVPDEVVEEAIMTVEFDQGMPLVDGTPIWERFDGEVVAYYKLFKEYREALYVGGSRAITQISAIHKVPGKFLHTLSKMYHWQVRCKAYDAFKRVEFERKRQFEIQQLSNKHTKAADFLLNEALTYLEDHPEQLNPKIALQMLETGMKAGRLALGLNGDKPGDTVSGGGSTNIKISQSSNGGNGDSSAEMTTSVQIGGNSDQADTSYLQSIVHILDQSGALDEAKRNVIDAEYTEVEEESKNKDEAL